MAAMSEYSDVVLEHYRNPRNVGEFAGSPATAQVGDPATGDVLRLSLSIEGEIVIGARFKSFGCTAAIAAAGSGRYRFTTIARMRSGECLPHPGSVKRASERSGRRFGKRVGALFSCAGYLGSRGAACPTASSFNIRPMPSMPHPARYRGRGT